MAVDTTAFDTRHVRRRPRPIGPMFVAAWLAAAVLGNGEAIAGPARLKASGPYAGLTYGKDGLLYGIAAYSAAGRGEGSVYRLKPDGKGAGVLANFTGGYPYGKGNGSRPRAALTVGPGKDLRLYGTAVAGGWAPDFSAYGVVFSFGLDLPRIRDIHVFGKPPADESNSWSTLLLLPNGRMYGTTSGNPYGLRAAVFSVGTDGAYSRLGQFPAASPTGGVVSSVTGLTRVGNQLYGVTTNGGTAGLGSVFRIPISGGTPTTVHSFVGKDGAEPRGELALGPDGALYGTTYSGGSAYAANVPGSGTIFRVTTAGAFRKLVDFDAAPAKTGRARAPIAGLTYNSADGWFYGTTTVGGNGGPNQSWAGGTFFRVSPKGAFQKRLDFYGDNGMYPTGRLLLHAGQFYGTTYSGGTYGAAWAPAGIVFRVTPGGVLTKLAEFDGS